MSETKSDKKWYVVRSVSGQETFASSGVLLEKYNVCEPEIKAGGGEYDVQLGFGWTNGVYTRFQTYLNQ